jgi:hypothetical protein
MGEHAGSLFSEESVDPIVDMIFTNASNFNNGQAAIDQYSKHLRSGASHEEALAAVERYHAANGTPSDQAGQSSALQSS